MESPLSSATRLELLELGIADVEGIREVGYFSSLWVNRFWTMMSLGLNEVGYVPITLPSLEVPGSYASQ